MTMAKTKKEGVAKKAIKYKKAPEAPKRFKSAFIIFSAEKHKLIKKDLLEDGKTVKTTEIAKLVSEAWKKLTPDDRKPWDESAEKDKIRYEAEKALYKGPWKIPSNKRKTKDPSAPKRPMSAFLAYSNSRRAGLKRDHPKSTNADLSRMLSKTWKELPPTDRGVYMAEEREKREKYKVDMAEWREKVAKEKEIEREEREVAALHAAENPPPPGINPDGSHQQGMENKWMGGGPGGGMQQPGDEQQQQQFQQAQQEQHQQRHEMAQASMLSNPYLHSGAFGGGQMDARAAALAFNPAANNPYLTANMNMGAFAGHQSYMQGGGNPALALFGAQSYMQNAGMQGQMQGGGLYGSNFPGMGGPGPGDGGNQGAQPPHPPQSS